MVLQDKRNFQKNTLFFSNLAYFVFLVSCSNSSPCGGDVPIKTAQEGKICNPYNKRDFNVHIFKFGGNLKNNKNKKTKCQNQSGFKDHYVTLNKHLTRLG